MAKEKSFGNSQVLPRDYVRKDQIELVLKELSDQAATRLRNSNCQTECVSIFVGYSKEQVDGLGDWAGLVGENSLKSLVATTQKC